METAQSSQVFDWRPLSEDLLAIYILTPKHPNLISYSNLILLHYCDLTHHFNHRVRCVSLTVLCCPDTAKSSSLVHGDTQRNTHLEYIQRKLAGFVCF